MTKTSPSGAPWRNFYGRRHGKTLKAADLIGIAIAEQCVELRAVSPEIVSFMEDFAKGMLNFSDLSTDPNFPAQPGLQIGSSAEMIGVDMGLDNPVQFQPLPLNIADKSIGMIEA